MQTKRPRAGGNAMIFVMSIMALSFATLLVAFSYTRVISSHQEQTSAVGAAALAVAKDLPRVIIDDPNFGYVALCDYAPSGSGVAAKDGFGLPVHGINTIFATIRLDMIIADKLNDPVMKAAALTDYNNAVAASRNLETALRAAIEPENKSFYDVSQKPVSIYADALEAYKSNVIRSNGKSQLLPDSLKLTLGYSQNEISGAPVPSPSSMDLQLPAAAVSQGYYLANKAIPQSSCQFVFCGLSSGSHLINDADFHESESGLPYSVPTAVKVEASQQFTGHGASQYTVITDN